MSLNRHLRKYWQEPFFGIGPDVLPSRKISTPMVENIHLGRQNFAILQTSSENFLITCGNWGNSFRITSLNDGKIVQSVRNHKDVVSCVAGRSSLLIFFFFVLILHCGFSRIFDNQNFFKS